MAALAARELAHAGNVVCVGFGVEDVVSALLFGFFESVVREIDANDFTTVGFEILDPEVTEAATADDRHPVLLEGLLEVSDCIRDGVEGGAAGTEHRSEGGEVHAVWDMCCVLPFDSGIFCEVAVDCHSLDFGRALFAVKVVKLTETLLEHERKRTGEVTVDSPDTHHTQNSSPRCITNRSCRLY